MTPILRRCTILALLALTTTACERCQPPRASLDPLEAVPGGASIALLQRLGDLSRVVTRMQQVSEQTGADNGLVKDLIEVMGFDPTTEAGWQQAGLDPARPVVASVGRVPEELVLVLPISDPEALEKLVRTYATRIGRADLVDAEKKGGKRDLRFARSFGDRRVELASVHIDEPRRLAFVGMGPAGAAALPALVTTPAEQSLARDPTFAADRGRVRPGAVLWRLRGEGLALALRGVPWASQIKVVVASTDLAGGSFWVDAYAGLEPALMQRLGAANGLTGTPPDLLSLSGDDAVLAAAFELDVASALRQLKAAVGGADNLERLAPGAGVDVEQTLTRLLAGGVAAGLYLRDPAQIAAVLGSPRWAQNGLWKLAELHGLARLKPEAAPQALAALDQTFQQLGLSVQTLAASGVTAHSAGLAEDVAPPTAFLYAVRGTDLYFGLGEAWRFDQLLSRGQGQGQAMLTALPPAIIKDVAGAKGASVVVAFPPVTRALEALARAGLRDPTLAATSLRAAELSRDLRALDLQLRAEPDGLRLGARLEMVQPQAAQP